MTGIQLSVHAGPREMGLEDTAVVRQVIGALIVVRDSHVAVAQQALRGDQVMGFVARGWRSLKGPHDEEHGEGQDRGRVRRQSRPANDTQPFGSHACGRTRDHTQGDHRPHQQHRSARDHQKDIRYRQWQPGQHDQEREKQRKTFRDRYPRRNNDCDRRQDEDGKQPPGREKSDPPRGVRAGDCQ